MAGIDLPVDEMAARYEAGESLRELARFYGVSKKTVWNRLGAADVKMRRSGWPGTAPVPLPVREMAEGYEAGESKREPQVSDDGGNTWRMPWADQKH